MTAQILIADHDPLVREQFVRCLSAHGYDVAVAADGLQCVEQLRTCCPDLLVLDPGILWGGGLGVLEWLKCERPAKLVKVVVLVDSHFTGNISEEDCEDVAARLERPTSLTEMTEFVSGLQRLLESDDGPISHSTKRQETATR